MDPVVNDPRDVWEAHAGLRQRRRQCLVGQTRYSIARRLATGADPVIQIQQKGPQQLIGGQRVLRLLTDALRGSRPVRKAREQVIANIASLIQVEIMSLTI